MGRPCSVSDEEITLLIQKHMQYFMTNNFPPVASKVWKDMSKELGGRWKPHSVYTHVRENKKGNLMSARKNLNINVEFEKPTAYVLDNDTISEPSEDSELDKSHYNDENENFDTDVETFNLVLSQTEWEQIKPDEASKNHNRLKPRVWANVISRAFWNMYKLPCAFLAKWSYVRGGCIDENDNDIVDSAVEYYLKFKGACKSAECGNEIVGIAHKQPVNGKLTLVIKTRYTRNTYHEEVKRPLNGPERKITGRELKRKMPVGHRQKLLADNMEYGENEPPWIQKSHIYRQAKMESNHEELGLKKSTKTDMITNIRDMLSNSRYNSAIRDIGVKTFYVFYCTPEQVFVEKEYCRVKKGSSQICLDATGSVIKKFEKFPGHKTGHIFLYTVTINFEGKTLPVYQMVSERHDAPFITFWLKDWIRRCAATIPNVAVSDLGRALLVAMSEAFNRITVREYVDVLFKWATLDDHKTPQPFNTYIRTDVAHQMAATTRWKCIKELRHPVIRNFYLRTIALMIGSHTVQEFEHIFRLTCIIALHQNLDDIKVLAGKQISVLTARNLLEELMSERGDIIKNLETLSESVQVAEDVEKTLNEVDQTYDETMGVTHQWIKSLIQQSTPECQENKACGHVNGFYFAEFIPSLERFAKEFPISTAACLPGTQNHASSAYQERYFSEMRKKIFEGIPLPCSANKFLKEHIDDLQSGANEVAAKLKHFNHKHVQAVLFRDRSENECELLKKKPAHFPRSSLLIRQEIAPPPGAIEEKSSPSCLSEGPFSPSVQYSTSSPCTISEKFIVNGRSTSGLVNLNFGSISPLYNKARMLNDTDFKSGKTWKGLLNEDSFLDKVKEPSFGNEEECTSLGATVQDLPFGCDDSEKINRNRCSIDPRNDAHSCATIGNEGNVIVRNETEITVKSSASETHTSLNASLRDHDYSKPGSDEISIEFQEKDQKSSETKSNNKKLKKEGYYFKPNPQIKFMTQNLELGGKRGFLLRNGTKLGIMKIGDIAVDLQQTCAFDAIMHILQIGAIYNSEYHYSIKSSNNRALKFLCQFIETGPTVKIFQQRIRLLNEHYPLTRDPEAPTIKPHKLIAADSITTMWKHLFCTHEPTEPSATQFPECNNPSCVRSLPKDIAYIGINTKKVNRSGVGGLQEAISFIERYFNVKCRQKDCRGTVTETTRPNFHIFIDLDTRTNSNPNKKLECQLTEFPVTLKLGLHEYQLIGVIAHIPNHFIAYCRKPTGRWIECDDMDSQIKGCDNSKTVTPIGAIYISISN